MGINATDINHSAGRYHQGQSPPLQAGLEVLYVLTKYATDHSTHTHKQLPLNIMIRTFYCNSLLTEGILLQQLPYSPLPTPTGNSGDRKSVV